MSTTHPPTEHHHAPGMYEIRIKGHLDSRWAHWFEGLTITLEDNGETLLAGPVVDQAALHGVLKRVRDLGMALLSVDLVPPNQEDAALPAATDDKYSIDVRSIQRDLSPPIRANKEKKS